MQNSRLGAQTRGSLEDKKLLKSSGCLITDPSSSGSGIDSSSRPLEQPTFFCTQKLIQMRYSFSSASILLFFLFLQCSLQQCYNPDGGIAPHDIPCTEFASDSDAAVPCCAPGSTCLPSKMCESTDSTVGLFRGTCSDREWNSLHCPGFCRDYNLNTTIFNCTAMNGHQTDNYNNFCCAGSSPQCCDYMNLVFQDVSALSSSASSPDLSSSTSSLSSSSLASSTRSSALSSTATTAASSQSASHVPLSSSSSSGSSVLSSSSATLLSSSSSSISGSTTGRSETNTDASIPSIVVANPTTTQSNSSGSNRDWNGVGIGAGIGAAVPLLILLIVGSLLWRRHRRRALQKLLEFEDGASSRITKDPSIRMTRPAYLKAHEADGIPRYELETVRGAEADGFSRYELENVRGVEMSVRSPRELPVRCSREMPVRSPRELPGSERERYRHQTYRSGSLNNPAELY